MCESSLMAQVLTFTVLAFLFLQLAAGQNAACTNATLAYFNAIDDSCAPNDENPALICSEQCRDLYQDVIDNCPPAVSSYYT